MNKNTFTTFIIQRNTGAYLNIRSQIRVRTYNLDKKSSNIKDVIDLHGLYNENTYIKLEKDFIIAISLPIRYEFNEVDFRVRNYNEIDRLLGAKYENKK